jgi:hypothetical protein
MIFSQGCNIRNTYRQNMMFTQSTGRQMIESSVSQSSADDGQLQMSGPFLAPALLHALFWKPRFLVDAPLTTYLPLLNWLVSVARPRRIGVLGCDDGAAHFALCQALDRLRLDGRCQGFGFWRDADSGEPTDPPSVLRHHEELLYEDLSQLESCETLATALDRLPMKALDLLVCDLASLPPQSQISGERLIRHLSPNGILLIHGTRQIQDNQPDTRGFARFLSAHPHVEFPVEEGMVLLASETVLPVHLQALFDAAPGGHLRRDIEQVFRRCGQAVRAAATSAARLAALQRAEKSVATTTKQLQQVEKSLKTLQDLHEQRSTRLAETQSELLELRHEFRALTAARAEAETALEAEQQARARADAATEARAQELAAARAEAETALAKRTTALDEAHAALEAEQQARARADAAAEVQAQELAAARAEAETARKVRFDETAALTRIAEDLRDRATRAEAALAECMARLDAAHLHEDQRPGTDGPGPAHHPGGGQDNTTDPSRG